MNAKQRVAASRAEQPADLAANERGCDRISLRAAPMKRSITPNQPGIRGMSAHTLIRLRAMREFPTILPPLRGIVIAISEVFRRLARNRTGQSIGMFLCFILLAFLGQSKSGVYRADLSQFADAGAHYVNGLLIYDYLVDGLPNDPVDYALNYYVHYPRVTISHWPPLYYTLQAAIYFITGPSIQTALLLQAIFGAAIAAIVGYVISRIAGWTVALLAGLATLAAPGIFVGMQDIMLDLQITFLTSLAMLAWARFLVDDDWRWSLAFGIVGVVAILTKGNGILLALVPLLSVVLTGRLSLLSNWRFWLPALLVAVLTLPWYLVTYRITVGSWGHRWGWDYTSVAVPAYGSMLFSQIGPIGGALSLLGAFRVLRDREWNWRRALSISAICLIIGGFAFTCIIPAGIDARFLVPLVPALIILAYFGIDWIVGSQLPQWRGLVIPLSFLVIIGAEYKFFLKNSRAMNAASEAIFAGTSNDPFILVGSTNAGEAAITAEVATRDRLRQWYVIRGFAVLGSGDFMGTDYRPRFENADDLAQWIERQGIGWVVIDTSPSSLFWAHNALLLKIAQSDRKGWKLAGRFPITTTTGETFETFVYKIPNLERSVDHTKLLSAIKPTRMFQR